MKKLIISVFFAFLALSTPAFVHAGFDPGQIIDPFCLFACSDDEEPQDVYNTYTNSNNVNSNVNSPGATISNSGNNAGNEVKDGGQVYYDGGPVVSTTPVYVYNNNNNTSNSGGGSYYYDGGETYSRLTVSCTVSDNSIEVGDTVTWRASPNGGNGDYNVSWDGTNGLSGNGTSITKRYNTTGTKNASITVRSGNQTIHRNCDSIEVYDHYRNYDNSYDYNYDYDYYDGSNRNLYVTCRANVTFAPAGTRVVWEASVSGGSGNYKYDWTGTEGLHGTSRSVSYSYNNPGPKTAYVTVRSGNYKTTQNCSNYVTVGVPIVNYNQYPTYTAPTYVAPATKVVTKYVEKKVVVSPSPSPSPEPQVSSLFSLQNVPWGLVAILVIIVLLITVIYLIVNKPKI